LATDETRIFLRVFFTPKFLLSYPCSIRVSSVAKILCVSVPSVAQYFCGLEYEAFELDFGAAEIDQEADFDPGGLQSFSNWGSSSGQYDFAIFSSAITHSLTKRSAR